MKFDREAIDKAGCNAAFHYYVKLGFGRTCVGSIWQKNGESDWTAEIDNQSEVFKWSWEAEKWLEEQYALKKRLRS